ncbi:hypothetical protein [Nostoc sp. LEGE 12450]|uniref:hypothetical protein n=1 Tax=Nostoc sp. LEGE 12450 TaxID=1828643 RepID=UPI00187F7EB7|nr:hypothetical protein [Nostoc sp. LEGE 12450]MBE8992400.1 hypothetical protein [Nostoc sp. LEGE 12450]
MLTHGIFPTALFTAVGIAGFGTCICLSKKLPIHRKLIEVAKIATRLGNTCQSSLSVPSSNPKPPSIIYSDFGNFWQNSGI